MRALRLAIHNFRSLRDITIELQDLSLVAGANNAGKSNLIDAIRLFYADQSMKWVDSRDKPMKGDDDGESWVEIEYTLTPEELESLKDVYVTPDNTMRVRNYFRSSQRDAEGKTRSGYYGYEDGVLADTPFYGARNVGSGKFGSIVYIPAVSKIDDQTKLTGPSPLRDLIANVLKRAIVGSKAYTELTESFEVFEKEMKTESSDEGRSLKSLEDEITHGLKAWDTSFKLGIQTVQPDDIVKSLIKPQLVDMTHGQEIDQIRFGAGFQRHLVYTLIKLAARYSTQKKLPSPAKEVFSPNLTWILFEEPEAFLHPPQEDELYRSLLEVVEDESSQVLLTTHSARFVSHTMDNLTRLIRLRRDNAITSSHQLSQAGLDELFDEAHMTDSEIEPMVSTVDKEARQKLMSAMKLELWIQPHRAASFFSRRAVIVEGPSEVGLYSYLVSRGILHEQDPGIVLVDTMGKYNIHRFMGLFSAFGIDHAVLYDGDGGEKHDAEVTKAIETARTTFTKKIHRLDDDIETLLGIPPLDRSEKNKKPQYILYNLESDAVSKESLQKVVECFDDVCASD